MNMNVERGRSLEEAFSREDADLKKKQKELESQLKEVSEFGDAKEIADLERQLRKVELALAGVPRSHWAQEQKKAEQEKREYVRSRKGYIPEHMAYARPPSELFPRVLRSIDRDEEKKKALETKEVLADITDAREAGEVVRMPASEYAALQRTEREKKLAELRATVDAAYDASTTKGIAKARGMELRSPKSSEEETEILDEGKQVV